MISETKMNELKTLRIDQTLKISKTEKVSNYRNVKRREKVVKFTSKLHQSKNKNVKKMNSKEMYDYVKAELLKKEMKADREFTGNNCKTLFYRISDYYSLDVWVKNETQVLSYELFGRGLTRVISKDASVLTNKISVDYFLKKMLETIEGLD